MTDPRYAAADKASQEANDLRKEAEAAERKLVKAMLVEYTTATDDPDTLPWAQSVTQEAREEAQYAREEAINAAGLAAIAEYQRKEAQQGR